MSPEKEIAQAKNLAEAGKAAGVEHVIWSTLEDTRAARAARPTTACRRCMGKYKVPHFDTKGESDALLRPRRADDASADVVLLGQLHLLRHGAEAGHATASSRFVLPMGDKKLPGIAAEDIGKCAYGVFKRGAAAIGKTHRHRRRAPDRRQMAAAMSAGARARGHATTTCRRPSTASLRLPGRRRSRQHVPVQRRVREASSAAPAACPNRARSIRSC